MSLALLIALTGGCDDSGTSADSGGSAGCEVGYDPCLTSGPDVDCEGGTGDGPRYTGPVTVTGSDPYGLDANGDGIGCEE